MKAAAWLWVLAACATPPRFLPEDSWLWVGATPLRSLNSSVEPLVGVIIQQGERSAEADLLAQGLVRAFPGSRWRAAPGAAFKASQEPSAGQPSASADHLFETLLLATKADPGLLHGSVVASIAVSEGKDGFWFSSAAIAAPYFPEAMTPTKAAWLARAFVKADKDKRLDATKRFVDRLVDTLVRELPAASATIPESPPSNSRTR